ncbi:hypothetical protein BH24ACI4_BH24ACI4_11850 [soil metagenome]
MVIRALVAGALILMAGLYANGATGPELTPPRLPLAAAPMTFGPWTGHDATPFADDVLDQLGVDDYIHRRYSTAGGAPVSVYVGYYASQRQGDTIHSPQNCLPGAGWRSVFADRATIPLGSSEIPVNRFVIQKGLDRQAVFYWYHGRGRAVASEFANKGWLMLDAARLHRTDGGLVRLITPITETADAAFDNLAAFSTLLVPQLSEHLP